MVEYTNLLKAAVGHRLRSKLYYNRMSELQPELMSLYNGLGQATATNPASFTLLHKFKCHYCAFFAFDPKLDAGNKYVCGPCQRPKVNYQDISKDDQDEIQACMFFYCPYNCTKAEPGVHLHNLITHIKQLCPMRPIFCSNRCGDFKLPEMGQSHATPSYICEDCFTNAFAQYEQIFQSSPSKISTQDANTQENVNSFKAKGRIFQTLKAKQEAKAKRTKHNGAVSNVFMH